MDERGLNRGKGVGSRWVKSKKYACTGNGMMDERCLNKRKGDGSRWVKSETKGRSAGASLLCKEM